MICSQINEGMYKKIRTGNRLRNPRKEQGRTVGATTNAHRKTHPRYGGPGVYKKIEPPLLQTFTDRSNLTRHMRFTTKKDLGTCRKGLYLIWTIEQTRKS